MNTKKEILNRYRKTPKGVITDMYNHHKYRNRKNGFGFTNLKQYGLFKTISGLIGIQAEQNQQLDVNIAEKEKQDD